MLAMAVTSTMPTAELIFVDRDDFLDDALLGRRKNGALDAEQKEAEDRRAKGYGTSSAVPIIAMMANCAQRLVTMTLRLEKRSETQPAVGRKKDERQDDDRGQDGLDHAWRRSRRYSGLCGKKFRRHRRAQRDEHKLGGIVIQQDLNLHRHE